MADSRGRATTRGVAGSDQHHYVSEFLLQPWRLKSGKVKYYDFDNGRLHHRGTGEVFCLPGLNTDGAEKAFNRYIETPVSRLRERLLSTPVGTRSVNIDDWAAYRALYLLVLIQGARASEAFDGPVPSLSNADLFELGEAALDHMVQLSVQRFQLMLIPVGDPDRLFFPSTGIFGLPLPDERAPTRFSMCIGMPLTPSVLVALTPTTVLANATQGVTHVAQMSIGAERARQVIIPPDYVAHVGKQDLIATMNTERVRVVAMMQDIQELHLLLERAHEITGLPARP